MKQEFTLPSLTVPDDSYSIKEILERFTRGVDPMLSKLPTYDTEQDDPKNLEDASFEIGLPRIEDFTDIDEIKDFIGVMKLKQKAYEKKLKDLEKEKTE